MNSESDSAVLAEHSGQFHFADIAEAEPAWNSMIAVHPDAVIYHRAPWREVLRRAFGIKTKLAWIGEPSSIRAGCLLARGGLVSGRRMIALPFSDLCPPLARDPAAGAQLLDTLATSSEFRRGLELRGTEAPPPWSTLRHFVEWRLDLGRPLSEISRKIYPNFRRQIRKAREQGMVVNRTSDRASMRAFFEMQLHTRRQLGLPGQPLRFFETVQEVFAPLGSLDIWLASLQGRPIAGVIVLRDGEARYMKWSARAADCPDGASQLLQMSLIEEYAGSASYLDLGRTDSRNDGLNRFKRHMGGECFQLPYSYFPKMPSLTSAENLETRWAQIAANVWRNLPLPLSRMLSTLTYKYLG